MVIDWLEIVRPPKEEEGGGKFLLLREGSRGTIVAGFCLSFQILYDRFCDSGRISSYRFVLIGAGTINNRCGVEKWKAGELDIETPVEFYPEIDGLLAKHRRQVLNARNGF